jgi:hypothetical protein
MRVTVPDGIQGYASTNSTTLPEAKISLAIRFPFQMMRTPSCGETETLLFCATLMAMYPLPTRTAKPTLALYLRQRAITTQKPTKHLCQQHPGVERHDRHTAKGPSYKSVIGFGTANLWKTHTRNREPYPYFWLSVVALTTCCLTEISSAHASRKPRDHHRQGTQANTDAADNRNARNVCSERLLRGAPSRTRTCAPGSGGRCSNPLSYERLSLLPYYSREPGSLQPKLR